MRVYNYKKEYYEEMDTLTKDHSRGIVNCLDNVGGRNVYRFFKDDGSEMIPENKDIVCRYYPFYNGRSYFRVDNAMGGFIDTNGKVVIKDVVCDTIMYGEKFKNKTCVALIKKENFDSIPIDDSHTLFGMTSTQFVQGLHHALMDINGRIILTADKIVHMGKNYLVQKGEDIYFVNTKGKRISRVYTNLENSNTAYKNGKTYKLNKNGKIDWVKTIQIPINFDLYTYVAILLGVGASIAGEFSLFYIFVLLSIHVGGKRYERRKVK